MMGFVIVGTGRHASAIRDWSDRHFRFPTDQVHFEGVTPKFSASGVCEFIVAIGDNQKREAAFAAMLLGNHIPIILPHPRACVSESVSIGMGTVICANATINGLAKIGVNCIINTCAVIEHHCEVGDHAHIGPRACLAGGVKIGAGVLVGAGAVVLPEIAVGNSAVIGAGAVVTKNVMAGAIVAGNPAKELYGNDRDDF